MEKRYVIVAEDNPVDDSFEDRYKEKNIVNYKDYYWMYTDELTEEELVSILNTHSKWLNFIGWYGIIDLSSSKILTDTEEQDLHQRNKFLEKSMSEKEFKEKFHEN